MAGRTVWYPGHMAKGSRELRELIKQLDVLIEIRDARAPELTASPQAKDLEKMRPLWTVLSRRDLADEKITRAWLSHYRERGRKIWAFSLLRDPLGPLKKELAALAPAHRGVRLAVMGIPNVGKSQLLNRLMGKSAAKVGALPGVTRGVSWFSNKEGMVVVDSPGILDPKSDPMVHRMLAWMGSSRSEVVGSFEILGAELLAFLRARNLWHLVEDTWGELPDPENSEEDDLSRLGRRLGCLRKGGVVDRGNAGKRLLEGFARGKLGRISLESPDLPVLP